MNTSFAGAVEARCPLCGLGVVSGGRHGRAVAFDLRAIRLGSEPGRGYMLCDDCGLLADLPAGLTLN